MAKVSHIALVSLAICLSYFLSFAASTPLVFGSTRDKFDVKGAVAHLPIPFGDKFVKKGGVIPALAKDKFIGKGAVVPATTPAKDKSVVKASEDCAPGAGDKSVVKGGAVAHAPNGNKFVVEGRVYCDTCRVEFETKISEPIKGAVVKLECRNRTDETLVSHSKDIKTDETGAYKIYIEGDHEEEICEVSLVKSPRADCCEPTEIWRKARVVLTKKDGVSGTHRFANNLGFMKKTALPGCKQVLTEMGYYEILEEAQGH